jgi:hypothetical protein
MAAELRPDRYYLLSDAGSFFFEPSGDNEGFESPEAAAEWARTQTVWPELHLSDGYAVRSGQFRVKRPRSTLYDPSKACGLSAQAPPKALLRSIFWGKAHTGFEPVPPP